MSDFQTFVAARLSEVDYQDPRTETFIKDSTVRQLKELSSQPVDFLDGSYTFTTTAGQDNYSAGYTGFPADLYGFLSQPYVIYSTTPITRKYPINGPVPLDEVRRSTGVAIFALNPRKFAWHNRAMWFWPSVLAAVTISGDYRKDGTRDDATGNPITTTSTTASNAWFTDGENVLRCAVLLDWFASIAKDQNAVQMYGAMLQAAQKNLTTARAAKRVKVLQAGDTIFDPYDAGDFPGELI